MGELTLESAFPRDRHIDEMLYGYPPAVATGFLLTAFSELDRPSLATGAFSDSARSTGRYWL
jgi:hypothetical protein